MSGSRIKSLLSKGVESLLSVVVPDICPICGKTMVGGESFICFECRLSAPYTEQWKRRENIFEQRFWGVVPICRASAFLWFVEGSCWVKMIHDLKYHSLSVFAKNMGRWYAAMLSETDFLDGVDLIVPVPLYWIRRLTRGYNQSEYIAAGISEYTSIPCCFNAVRRVANNPSQTHVKSGDRWDNVEDIFSVIHPEKLRSHHILIVDDVLTTGATIISLATKITDACCGDVTISVATLAASKKQFGVE